MKKRSLRVLLLLLSTLSMFVLLTACDIISNSTDTPDTTVGAEPMCTHEPVIDPAVSPTCITTGLTEGSHCSICGTVLTPQTELPTIDHVPVADPAVSPTCTTTGLTEGSHCSLCNTVLTPQTELPTIDHVPVVDPALSPTCITTGLTEGSHCSLCSTVFTAQESIDIDPMAHSYVDHKCLLCGTFRTLTLKELRCNIDQYTGLRIACEGVVTKNIDNGVYIEEYDPESDTYYGMYVYYGFSLPGKGLQIITGIGNRVRIVGMVYEFYGTWQISDIEYNRMEPNHPNNIQLISENHSAAYAEVTIPQIEAKVTLPVGEEGTLTEFDYANLILGTTVSLKNVTVVDIYTTNNGSDDDGAMRLTCRDSEGNTIIVRTLPLYQDGELVTESTFAGKTIDVRGIMDIYDGHYQIRLLSMLDVIIY